MKIELGLWIKKIIIYCFGLFIMALGVSLSKMSNLGVSPVNSIPCVLSNILNINMGICTTGVFILFIFIQLLILRKEFKPHQVLQVLCSFLFGAFVSLSNAISYALLPQCQNYFSSLLYLFISIILVALGIFLYINAELLSLPGEGVMQAVSYKSGIKLATAKLFFDWSMVLVAALLSLVFLGKLEGVREGTVIAAFGVGLVLSVISEKMKGPLERFLCASCPQGGN